ncbi:RNA polymerase II transcriptional coactivator SUB1, partial [Termitomyces sp. J132]
KNTSDGDKYVDLGKKKRATVRSFKGTPLIDIREFYGNDDDEKPGKKGISLTLEQVCSAFLLSIVIVHRSCIVGDLEEEYGDLGQALCGNEEKVKNVLSYQPLTFLDNFCIKRCVRVLIMYCNVLPGTTCQLVFHFQDKTILPWIYTNDMSHS